MKREILIEFIRQNVLFFAAVVGLLYLYIKTLRAEKKLQRQQEAEKQKKIQIAKNWLKYHRAYTATVPKFIYIRRNKKHKKKNAP